MSLFDALPRLASRWRRFWSLGDDALRDLGAEGERLVARARLAVCAVLLCIPARGVAAEPDRPAHYVALGAALVATALGVGAYAAGRRGPLPPALGFAAGAVDVTLVTLTLGAYAALGAPRAALGNPATFDVYFLAIGATCLRYDRRACVLAGGLAVTQYAALAAWRWELDAPSVAGLARQGFSWVPHAVRLVLLGAATLLAAAVVGRAEHLRRLSTRDRLTGLYNRGHFDERLGQELARAARGGEPLAVALIDVDHFKRFNDAFGHAAGDAALRAFANTLRRHTRAADVVARYGGEEFALLMPATDAAGAVRQLERLRREWSAAPVDLPRQGAAARLTASVGVATWPADATTRDDLIDRADSRLFEAKRLGRDRVVGPPGATGQVPAVARAALGDVSGPRA
jgi:diguanylate cyclase (GGDEF)-like protein